MQAKTSTIGEEVTVVENISTFKLVKLFSKLIFCLNAHNEENTHTIKWKVDTLTNICIDKYHCRLSRQYINS